MPSLVAECCLDLLCHLGPFAQCGQEGEHQGELNQGDVKVPTAPAAAQPGETAMSIGPSIAPTPQKQWSQFICLAAMLRHELIEACIYRPCPQT